MHLIENLLIGVGRDEGDGNTLGSETTGTTDTVEVLIGVIREIVVDDNIDTFNINTTTKEIGGNQDTSVEFLEGLVLGNTFFLLHTGVDADGWEVALGQESVKLVGTSNLGNENDNLVEFENIQQVVELAILLRFGKLDIVELKTVQSELGIIVDVDFHGILAKLLADWSNLLAERGAEHHHLLLVRSHAEDLLDITTHVEGLQDAIALVEDKVLNVIELESLFTGKSQDTSRCSDNNVRTVVLQNVTIQLDADTTEKDSSLDIGQVLGETFVLVGNLKGQLTGVAQNQDRNLILAFGEGRRVELMEGSKDEDGCLSHTRLSLTDNVHTKNGLRNTFVLDFRRMLKTAIDNSAETFRL